MTHIFDKIKRKNAEARESAKAMPEIDVANSMFCFAQNSLTVALLDACGYQGLRFGEDGGIYATIPGAEIEWPDNIQESAKKELAALVTLPAPDMLTRPLVNKQDLLDFFDQVDQIAHKAEQDRASG